MARLSLTSISAALLLSAALCTSASSQDLPLVAVYPMEASSNNAVNAFIKREQLDQTLLVLGAEETLRGSKRFKLFERDQKVLQSTIIKEQDRAACGEEETAKIKCDLRRFAGNAADIGKLSNVEFIVQIAIKDVTIQEPTYRPIEEFPGRFRKTNNASIDVSVKVLDTTSGQIKYQGSVVTSLGGKPEIVTERTGIVIRAVWTQLGTEAGRRVGNSIFSAIYPIEVVQTNGKSIFVNRGQGSGIQVGEIYEVYAVGPSMKDPKTGIDLGGEETLLGEVVIRRIAEKFSVSEPVGRMAQMPEAGAVLRLK